MAATNFPDKGSPDERVVYPMGKSEKPQGFPDSGKLDPRLAQPEASEKSGEFDKSSAIGATSGDKVGERVVKGGFGSNTEVLEEL